MPLSSCEPRSSKVSPEPATRSFTVEVTSTSPGCALAATLAPVYYSSWTSTEIRAGLRYTTYDRGTVIIRIAWKM